MRQDRDRYDAVAIGLHWLVALGVIGLIGIGLAMVHAGLPVMRQFSLYQLHKSIGITVLGLVVIRIVWRLGHTPPPLPDTMPVLERRAASGAHLALYAFLLLMPLTGWAVVSASPYNIPTVLYGVVPWPHLPFLATLPNKAAMDALFSRVHAYAGWALAALICLHAAAALRHHFVLRDTVLARMLPFLRRPNPTHS